MSDLLIPEQAVPDSELPDRTAVAALIKMAGLSPTPVEIDAMVASYPSTRQVVALLYSIPGVRYEEPAVTFDPRVVAQ